MTTETINTANEAATEGQITSYEFVSRNWRVHPPESADNTDPEFRKLVAERIEYLPYSHRNFFHELQPSDRDVPENLRFRYRVFLPPKQGADRRFDRATVLLHGLNEKSWDKYLPWARRLTQDTEAPVVLFPIAFHMDRAPAAWSNAREMMGVTTERRRLFPDAVATSFMNAALSHRVHFAPHRFLTSGLQSYFDVTELVRMIRIGDHELFREGTRVDFFGYSIGATLTELLLFADPAGLYEDSRAFLFCGGSVLDRANPVSKAIMDDRAHAGLLAFFDRLVSNVKSALPRGVELLKDGLWEVEVAKSLLFKDRLAALREKLARAASGRIAALGLAKDTVFPPEGLVESWTDANGALLVDVETADPGYSYTHESPFPADTAHTDAVSAFFDELFSKAAAHLRA